MKITYNRLFEIIEGLNTLGNNIGNGKFSYAVGKNTPRIQRLLKDYNEKAFDIRLENSQVDEKGSILKDAKGEFLFTKEGAKQRDLDLRALGEQEVEMEFYTLPELTKEVYHRIGVGLCDIFAGTLLKVEQVAKANENWNDFPEDQEKVAESEVAVTEVKE